MKPIFAIYNHLLENFRYSRFTLIEENDTTYYITALNKRTDEFDLLQCEKFIDHISNTTHYTRHGVTVFKNNKQLTNIFI